MYTMGRSREKKMVAANPFSAPHLLTHFAIIDAYHDWHDGKSTPSDCLDRVFRVLGARPGKGVLETAGYWFRRAVPKEPAFTDYVRRLGAHEAALARVYAVSEMSEPKDWELTLVATLSNDRSRRVRDAVSNCALMGRWSSVVPILREAQALRRDDPQRSEQTISLIERGYYSEADGSVSHYCGEGPGGAGGLGGAEVERADEALRILERVSAEELEYRRLHGRWPKRPRRGGDLLASLRDWSPLET